MLSLNIKFDIPLFYSSNDIPVQVNKVNVHLSKLCYLPAKRELLI